MADTIDIKDVASIFGGDAVADAEDSGTFVENMYKPNELVFGAVARKMVEAGWSVFPQEMSGNRRPGTVDGEMIKWSETHDLANKLPRPKALEKWIKQCGHLNVAVVLGPASGHTFSIDIDVVEEELSQLIQEHAIRILGDTPLKRVGRWPKMAFFYRHAPEDEIPSRALRFVKTENDENPDGDDQLLEIIGAGKPMTFYGHHHKTGRYFRWIEGPPHVNGPESAPIVTSAQLGEFLDFIDSIRPFSKSQSFDLSSVTWEYDEKSNVHVPKIRSYGAVSDWTENDEGKIVDGREAYLTRLAMRTVQANPDKVGHEAGVEAIVRNVLEAFEATVELTGKWRGRRLLGEVKSKVARFAKGVRDGKIKPSVPQRNQKGEYEATSAFSRAFVPPQPRREGGDSLDFLPPFVDVDAPGFDFDKKTVRRPMRIEVAKQDAADIAAKRAEREISEDRTAVAAFVQKRLEESFSAFWNEVYDMAQSHSRVHILKAPTGAGKTSRGINFIAADPRTKEPYVVPGGDGSPTSEGQAPILVLMPTYANIEELRHRAQVLNLDQNLSDKDLMKQALDMGLFKEDELESRLADIRRDAQNAGLKTMIYSGKLKAGCKMVEKVQMAMSAGLGTSAFCHSDEKKDKDGNKVKDEKFCPLYHHYSQNEDGSWNPCPVIQQKKEIGSCHVVFLPHAFLALQIPDELKNVRAVVADERIHHLFLHTTTFPLNVFLSPRKPPKLTKAEKEAGFIAEEFAEERQNAVREANYALKTNADVAEHLIKTGEAKGPDGVLVVGKWIEAAVRSCSASIAKDDSIDPETSMEELAEICARPTGLNVREELRFWKIVQERFEARKGERLLEELNPDARNDPDLAGSFTTKGVRDARIQLFQDPGETETETVDTIRISWRETPNWVERPLLLLDASAAPEMIKKIWQGKDVVVHDIPAALNVRVVGVADRTYSNASVIAKPSATPREKVQSAKLLANVRKSLCVISGYYGFSRVVAGGSILARRAVNTNWAGPDNVDWCHYGAMRGLDFAKYHAAAISVGRMELPIRIIDGLVAALTYDDDEPEQPYDKHGTGVNALGQPLLIPSQNQIVRMRSGHDLYMPVPMFPGKWGRMIQRQYREEELLQFLGRLRPVYREGEAPVWFSLSSVIPEEVIVDDLINIEDLVKRNGQESGVWEALRRCCGVLDVDLALRVCDDLFGNAQAVARHMKVEGIDVSTGALPARLAWALHSVRWTDAEGRTGFSFVRGEISDPVAALRAARAPYGLSELVEADRVVVPRTPGAARGRSPDTIEHELGTLSERRENEERQQVEVAVRILRDAGADAFRHLKVKKTERMVPILASTRVPKKDDVEDSPPIMADILEWEARASISALWRSKGYDPDKTEEPKAAKEGSKPETVTDEAVVRFGDQVNDAAQEFDLYRFDEFDMAIGY